MVVDLQEFNRDFVNLPKIITSDDRRSQREHNLVKFIKN